MSLLCHAIVDSKGSLVTVTPVSEEAKTWLSVHAPEGPDHTYFGGTLVLELRFAEAFLTAMEEAL